MAPACDPEILRAVTEAGLVPELFRQLCRERDLFAQVLERHDMGDSANGPLSAADRWTELPEPAASEALAAVLDAWARVEEMHWPIASGASGRDVRLRMLSLALTDFGGCLPPALRPDASEVVTAFAGPPDSAPASDERCWTRLRNYAAAGSVMLGAARSVGNGIAMAGNVPATSPYDWKGRDGGSDPQPEAYRPAPGRLPPSGDVFRSGFPWLVKARTEAGLAISRLSSFEMNVSRPVPAEYRADKLAYLFKALPEFLNNVASFMDGGPALVAIARKRACQEREEARRLAEARREREERERERSDEARREEEERELAREAEERKRIAMARREEEEREREARAQRKAAERERVARAKREAAERAHLAWSQREGAETDPPAEDRHETAERKLPDGVRREEERERADGARREEERERAAEARHETAEQERPVPCRRKAVRRVRISQPGLDPYCLGDFSEDLPDTDGRESIAPEAAERVPPDTVSKSRERGRMEDSLARLSETVPNQEDRALLADMIFRLQQAGGRPDPVAALLASRTEDGLPIASEESHLFRGFTSGFVSALLEEGPGSFLAAREDKSKTARQDPSYQLREAANPEVPGRDTSGETGAGPGTVEPNDTRSLIAGADAGSVQTVGPDAIRAQAVLQDAESTQTAGPDAGVAQTAGPDAGVALTAGPDAGVALTAGPDAGVALTAGPDTYVAQTAGPDAGVALTAGPDAGVALTAGPDAGVALTAGPDAYGAQTAGPDVASPKITQPDAAKNTTEPAQAADPTTQTVTSAEPPNIVPPVSSATQPRAEQEQANEAGKETGDTTAEMLAGQMPQTLTDTAESVPDIETAAQPEMLPETELETARFTFGKPAGQTPAPEESATSVYASSPAIPEPAPADTVTRDSGKDAPEDNPPGPDETALEAENSPEPQAVDKDAAGPKQDGSGDTTGEPEVPESAERLSRKPDVSDRDWQESASAVPELGKPRDAQDKPEEPSASESEPAKSAAAGTEPAELSASEPEPKESKAAEPEQVVSTDAEPEPEELKDAGPEQEKPGDSEREPQDSILAKPEMKETAVAEPGPKEALTAEPELKETSTAEPELKETSTAKPEMKETAVAGPGQNEAMTAEPELKETSTAKPEMKETAVAGPGQKVAM
ncbi:MAG: hypothetical protein LBT40_04855, partial [Deltaproteobacteria bacterium]|nr:hypothetical protein [Deltaproteobacteria bacterium]